ncbi:SgrR family transcriptional regulator [Agarivorans sp. 1_MG-2023]|uniref:ABC transporter substrate-binding protein n=1 Tax=Agarivorans sp. 1_MG-2023 TaxID=3062634 RepID=UPI0026E35CD7|nr:SgrR family transcriptional regulator [Agarivorans sp. 1_MG-2023]MDO6765160.1 SgrR family transcriptional regulator [Agarivorans sp. 1_MG-2023]
MQQLKLFRYYLKLIQFGTEQPVKLALADIATAVSTSPRHARTLLKQMADAGWLSWQPSVGRNQRSSLQLLFTETDLRQSLAKQQIALGDYGAALGLLNHDQQWFGRLLIATSGASHRDGTLNLQLTYSRQFSPILPHFLQRNSERFLLRQLYANLVSCNAEGVISSDLAHHWRVDNGATRYCFYLRPQLQFHDGSSINASAIVNLFSALMDDQQYAQELKHVATIRALNPLTIEFNLSRSDKGFAGLLADPKYSIQPAHQLAKTHTNDKEPIGSGPFELVSHNSQRLHLRANQTYHGYRALPDEVSIWFVERSTSIKEGQYAFANNDSGEQQHVQQRLEFGCQYLLFNQQNGSLNYAQRRWLAGYLQPEKILDVAQKSLQSLALEPALSLLDIWPDCFSLDAEEVELPAQLSIGFYQHDDLQLYAETIAQLLSQLGVSTELSAYSYAELNQAAHHGTLIQDIVITSYNLDDNRPASAFRWLFNDPLIKHCVGQQHWQWMQGQLEQVRANHHLQDYFSEMAAVANTMVSEYWCLPLFHHWQSLRFQNVLQDVAMTDWGWPQIKDVWTPHEQPLESQSLDIRC